MSSSQVKHDNSALPAKLKLRRRYLDKYTSGRIRVIDACAGEQSRIWSKLRDEYDVSYMGLDKKSVGRGVVRADSIRWLRTVPIEADVVDIDTYGEPWQHLYALAGNHPGHDLVVFLSYGYVGKGVGNISKLMKQSAGIPMDWPIPKNQAVREYCILSALHGVRSHGVAAVDISMAHNSADSSRYYAFILRKES